MLLENLLPIIPSLTWYHSHMREQGIKFLNSEYNKYLQLVVNNVDPVLGYIIHYPCLAYNIHKLRYPQYFKNISINVAIVRLAYSLFNTDPSVAITIMKTEFSNHERTEDPVIKTMIYSIIKRSLVLERENIVAPLISLYPEHNEYAFPHAFFRGRESKAEDYMKLVTAGGKKFNNLFKCEGEIGFHLTKYFDTSFDQLCIVASYELWSINNGMETITIE